MTSRSAASVGGPRRILSGILRVLFVTALALFVSPQVWAEDVVAGTVWPGFRGRGDSHAQASSLPLSWPPRGRAEGSWTIRLPGYGQSSPVVWKDQVFVTAVSGLEKEHLHLLSVQLKDGEIIWQRDFRGTQQVKDSDTVSRAAPTPVVDEQHVYALFESGDIHAVTHDGKPVWERSFVRDYGELQGSHGYASSPLLVDDLLIVQVAHSGPSYILALDKQTGENRWKVEHPSQTGWSSPVVTGSGNEKAVVISSSGSVRAIRVNSGEELWRVDDVVGNTIASPTVARELVLIGVGAERSGAGRGAGRGGAGVRDGRNQERSDETGTVEREARQEGSTRASLAIRLGGPGPGDDSRVAWRAPRVSVGYASPVAIDNHAYFVNRVGVLQCVAIATGELLWQHRLPGPVWATPVVHDGHLVIFCQDGQVVTLAGGSELRVVAESQLSATDIVYGVAAVDGSWIVRTGRGLTRIHAPAAETIGSRASPSETSRE